MHHFIKMYFIFLLGELIQVNFSQANAADEKASLQDFYEKCALSVTTCAQIPRWKGADCTYLLGYGPLTLTFRSMKYLPQKMFRCFNIQAVILLDRDADVAENVLEGILYITEFKVEASRIKVIPDFRFANNSLQTITLSSSLLTSLEGEHLQNLYNVWTLSFSHNFIQYIDADVFKGTEKVGNLNLDYNLLTYIPPKLLDNLKKLRRFSARHNHLLHVDGLFHVTRPKSIYLEFNNITNFSLSQLFNLDKTQLILKEKFYEFDLDVWDLDLSYNYIKETSSPLSICKRNHGSLFMIDKLKLHGNKIIKLNDCLRCPQVTQLEIIRNQIQFLTENDFLSVYNTRELFLQENQIRWIDMDTFKHFNTSLKVLNLSFNKIISINGSAKYLSNLIELNLNHNSIQTFAVDEFTSIQSLRQLYLDQNKIKSLGTVLQRMKMLEYLNITHNDIKLLKSAQLPKSLKSIELTGNPLICDCHNMPFYEMLKDDEKKGMSLRCKNERKHLNCPDECSCKCTEYGGDFSMFVDCSSRKLSFVPQFMDNNLSQLEVNEMFSSDERRYHVMYQNVDSSLHLGGNVLSISLENNRLDNLDAEQLPPNLVQLYLSNNKLTRFPQSVIDSQLNLKQLYLSGNPWKCDCDALEFKKWLISHIYIIKDFDNIRCGANDKQGKNLDGSVIWKLNDVDLCPVTDFVLILSVFFLSFVAVCLFAKVIYAKYELNIKVSLYSHGFTFVKEEVLDQNKAFDVFISFSYKDDEFVIKDIISEIEKRDPNIRLCLHYRHFRPGVPITDNITYAVQKSKRTVMILSRNYLQSEWCLLEFKTAHNQTLQDKVHRVIVIKIGELPKKIDPTIKLYLDSTTYLTWGENNFWNKFFYILPSQSSDARPTLRFVSDNETVFNL